MPPAVATLLPSPPPITDRIALGALASTFPPELVDQVTEQAGRAEQRRRLLPARVVVYFVLALARYGQAAYEEVLRCLVEGLGWATQARRGRRSWPYWHVPGASALAEARTRLGAEPLEVLFAHAARPLATTATRGAWYRSGRVLVPDGTCLDVPDSPANRVLGRARSGRGEGWAPSRSPGGGAGGGRHARDRRRRPGPVRGRGADAGPPACPRPWPAGAGVLLLADRLFVGWELWQAMAATGAELVWRVRCGGKTAPKLPVERALADGSWLSTCAPRTASGSRYGWWSTPLRTLAGGPAPTLPAGGHDP